MIIRKILKDEFQSISEIHKDAFKNFFLTSLGTSFLNTYYKSCLSENTCIALCASDDNGNLIGFALGTTFSKGFHKRIIISNMYPFLKQFILLIVKNPIALIRIFQNLDKVKNVNDNGQYAELLSIGVHASHKGLGIGKVLIQNFEKEIKKSGCTELTLTTDKKLNNDVINFYLKSGYEIFYEFDTYPKRKMLKLIKKL